jgi:hypothetical protein
LNVFSSPVLAIACTLLRETPMSVAALAPPTNLG